MNPCQFSFHKILLCFYTIAFFPKPLCSQDSTYIKKFPYNCTFEINPAALTQRLDVFKRGNNADTTHAVYMPNVNSSFGFNFSWKFLSIGYSFKIPFTTLNESVYGKTKFFNLSFSSFTRYVGAEAFYRKYERFFHPANESYAVRKRADVYFAHAGLNLYLFTNTKKFCYRAPFTQSRRQLKSAGGFILMSELAYKKFAGDSSILPERIDNAANFFNYAKMKSLTFGIFELKPAYAYDFVFKQGKYYICPMIAAGAGISPYLYKTETEKGSTIALHIDLNFKLALGYDVEHFFMNFIFQTDKNTNYLRKSLVFDHTALRADFTAGWRFGKK